MKFSREFRIGLVIVLALSGAIWGFNFLKGRNIFSPADFYYAVYDDINGLMVSNPVKAYGYKIGKVSRIEYLPGRPQGHLLVELRVENPDFRIPKDSKARIRSSDLLGSREVAIIMGKSSEFLAPGDTLNAQMEQGLSEQVNEMLAPLKVKVENLLGSVDTIIVAFKEVFDEKGMKNITTGLAGIRTVIDNVVALTEDLRGLISAEKGKISQIVAHVEAFTGNLKNNNKKLSSLLTNMEAASDSLRQIPFGLLGKRLASTAAHLDSLIVQVRSQEGTMGRLISSPDLYNDLDSTLVSLNALLEAIKNRPGEYITVTLFGRKSRSTSSTKGNR
ncbi:MAG: MlaD family protein [Flavobacteriales bacterium]|nr:MlaD family protein [Flavobacteriales bacterium]